MVGEKGGKVLTGGWKWGRLRTTEDQPHAGRSRYDVLLGTYSHALDEKGRVVLPAKFRRDLEEGAVLTKGEDGCLELFPNETWAEEVKEILKDDRRKIEVRRRRRLRFGEAHPITPDKQGRIAIPQELRDFAGMAAGRRSPSSG